MQAGASLQTSDLEKNGAATTDAIYKLIYNGKGKMPGYGKECTPRVNLPNKYHITLVCCGPQSTMKCRQIYVHRQCS